MNTNICFLLLTEFFRPRQEMVTNTCSRKYLAGNENVTKVDR